MGTFRTVWQGLDWSFLTDILIYIIPAMVCVTIHETCHGLVAYKLGDPTAKDAGRLSLNPIRHVDLIGLVMLLVCHFGWAKPVPVDARNFKDPKKGMALTALAGPVSNVLLTVVLLAAYGLLYFPLLKMGEAGAFFLRLVLTTAYLSTALAIFNIIPISPLDGSKVLFALLPERAYLTLMRYERYGMLVLLLLVWLDVGGSYLSGAIGAVCQWMIGLFF